MAIVGSAQVLIRPTFSGLQKEIRKELEAVGVPAGESAGRSMGDSLKKWGKRGALAAGGAIATVVGTALVKGFGRLQAIENAQAKMRGLGHDADAVRAIMDNALASVKGTAFGLGEAATVAASAVAAGIAPGAELEGVLATVANTAAAAGTGMDEMGSIFTKVASTGKAQNDSLNQLADRGIPIYQALAEQLGVTTEEVFKMASAGEIGFDEFTQAAASAAGTVADEMGGTLSGSFDNALAALGRVGANMMSGIYPYFAEFFQGVQNFLGPLEDKAAVVGEAVGRWMTRAAEGLKTFIQEFRDGEGAGGRFRDVLERVWGVLQTAFTFVRDTAIPALQRFGGWLVSIRGWLIPIAAGIGAIVAAWKTYQIIMGIIRGVTLAFTAVQTALNVVLAMNPIGLVVLALVGLAAAFAVAWNRSETFRNVVTAAWEGIKTAASAVWDWLKKAFQWIKDGIASVGQWFTDRGQDIQNAWNAVKDALGRAWEWIKTNVFEAVKSGLSAVGQWFTDRGNDIKGAWDSVKNALKAGYDFIKKWTFDQMVEGMRITWNFFKDRVDDIKGAWDSLKSAFRAVWDWISDNVFDRFRRGIDNIAGWVSDAVSNIDSAWRSIANKFRDPINWVINTVWNDGIARVFNNVADAIGISTRLSQNASIPRFAEGGRHGGGWALVGEEGPELVNFDRPGRVYTAAETAAALAQGRDLTREQSRAAAGRHPGEALAPMGGNWLSRAWGAVTGWVRGGLASAAELILNPITSRIASTMSQWGSTGTLFGDTMLNAKDRLLDWIRGKDDEAPEVGADGWVRPSRGPITSRFGPRWGGIHAGIDIAGGGPTFAAAAGEVLRTGWNILAGRTGIGILLQHAKDLFTYYGHNPVGGVRVRPGESVTAGQRIGAQGATGNVTGVHVHFELHKGGLGRAVNPEQLGVFDSGGWLKPGMFAANQSRTPEPVLTGKQWRDIHSLATRGSGVDGPIRLHPSDIDAIGQVILSGAHRVGQHQAQAALVGASRRSR